VLFSADPIRARVNEVIVNANQLENNPTSTATALRQTTLPFTVDPVLYRFQLPQWWRNQKGNTKKKRRSLPQMDFLADPEIVDQGMGSNTPAERPSYGDPAKIAQFFPELNLPRRARTTGFL